MTLSVVLMTSFGIIRTWKDYVSGRYMGFKLPCWKPILFNEYLTEFECQHQSIKLWIRLNFWTFCILCKTLYHFLVLWYSRIKNMWQLPGKTYE